jgi:hypothetical protein
MTLPASVPLPVALAVPLTVAIGDQVGQIRPMTRMRRPASAGGLVRLAR